ncbi:hypothetical protein PR202_ga07066 [Eleusine coracana subsp. coracana]|uniref:F-box domain-containing protein n=1 Tax=Eleusine coracana subsp. coracana TaxID=191504 RepID=A0AAV5BX13_ELECO|nr:hypothetical protein QOZ80_2AG0107940 [Eleusine coracana subsp. coracana]GJM90756.1 hypothetical protein PR202_ga07066 [Eleusine coracana subsp. coracana]
MGGGRRPSSPALAPASPLEDDDLLSEFLLRLPPVPSSLSRASLVCKRWHNLVSDEGFRRRFRDRHRDHPPLLGFFAQLKNSISFTPIMQPPDRIPSDCFSFLLDNLGECRILCCRHGLVLLLLPTRLLVWDPSSGDASLISIPSGFDTRARTRVFNGAVLRAAGDGGDKHSSHFQVVVVSTDEKSTRAFACVFSSETGEWSNPVSAACPSMVPTSTPGTLVRRSLYWALDGVSHGILEYGLDKQCLKVIDVTLFLSNVLHYRIWAMPVEGGVLGYLFYSISHKIELWKWSADRDGGAGWVLERSFELDEFLPRSSHDGSHIEIVGIVEDSNVFYLQTKTGVFMIHMESMQCKKVSEISEIKACHSFTSVYTTGLGAVDGEDGDEPLR